MRILVALMIVAGTAFAQQQDPNRVAEFQVNRLKDRLKLTDEQASKVKDIYLKDNEDRTKSDEARTSKITELLNDEQKKLYEEMNRGRGGFGGQGGQQFRFGQGGQGFGGGLQGGLSIDTLKTELSLTDEQVEKVKPIVDEFAASMQKRIEEFRSGGFQGLDWQAEIQKFQDNFKAVSEKIKAHLTDEQKTKADALYERATQWTRLIPQLGQRAQGGDRGAARMSPEERIRRAMDALKIEKDDERAAIKDLVEKIVKAQAELEGWQKASREKLTETARNKELSDAALNDRITETQDERRKREKEIASLQKQLIEVVNNRQEIELIILGILK
ncbi:MAG TPA: hypothetical protein VJB14_01185 [Planctomycetota bacterium]|nr:hypothetical protein [Planctomycetota bacterium]